MVAAGSACVAKRRSQSPPASHRGRLSIGLTSAESPLLAQSPAASSRRLRAPLTPEQIASGFLDLATERAMRGGLVARQTVPKGAAAEPQQAPCLATGLLPARASQERRQALGLR